MKRKFRAIIQDVIFSDQELFRYSFLIVFATMLGMIINYFFQVIVGRFLGPSDYGVFGSLMAILYIISVFGGAINISITKISSEFFVKKETSKIKRIFKTYSLRLLIIGSILSFLFFLFSSSISKFLKTNEIFSIILLAISFPLTFVSSNIFGIMRGMQRFKEYAIISVLQPIIKLALALILISFGFKVSGAIGAIVVSGVFVCFFALYYLKDVLKEKEERFEKTLLIKYSLPVLILSFCITAMINLDILLIKNLFSSEESGFYVAASTLSKIVFWISGSLIIVMFPKTASLNISEKSKARKIFRTTIVYTLLISLAFLFFTFLFPDFVIYFAFGENFLKAGEIIFLFFVLMSLISIIQIILNYDLSIDKIKPIYILPIFVIAEIFLIYSFHSSLLEIIKNLVLLNSFLLILLLAFNVREFLE